jgi:hypothetical protein
LSVSVQGDIICVVAHYGTYSVLVLSDGCIYESK